jgi:predicted DNA-binding protein
MKMLAKFEKSKRAKAKIVKLAVEYFLDELEFLEDCEKRLNDEDEETISEEEFRKEFDL